MTILRRAFVTASIAWAVLLPIAPLAASHQAPARFWYGLAFVVYGAGTFVCHQLPWRSFHSWSAQWPVCARCTGIYVGAAVAATVAMVRLPSLSLRPGKPDATYDSKVRLKPDTTYNTANSTRRARALLAVAALPSAITLVYEWTTGDTPSNAIRALAGVPLGAAVAFVIVRSLTAPRA